MVDREARDRLAELLRHLGSGQITNFEYEVGLPASADTAIREICSDVWLLYDDLREHRLAGRNRINPRERRDLATCILFLKTDLPYEWPASSNWGRLAFGIANLATLGLAGVMARRRFKSCGDFEVWPFIRRTDFDNARRTRPATGSAV